jgi:putative PIN family toxin of toxin-antitoxin system
VFDTNVWISGLMWRGDPYRCLSLARAGLVQLAYCPPMAAELAEKLRTKFRYSEHEIRAVVYELRRIASRVEITGQVKAMVADPDDDKFIECALVAGADLIVSTDRHLLDLVQYQHIQILSASDFLVRVDRAV